MSDIKTETPPTEPAVHKDNANATEPSINGSEDDTYTASAGAPKDLRFWLIIFGLLIATFLSALDMTAISTALPTISKALNSREFAWIGNAYSIAATAVIPWSGGLAHVFGRRPILLSGLLSFAVGSAMCGAALNMTTMLAGRTFQGVGSGIILSLVEIVLADLVPLSERGLYQGAFGAVWALASASGPPIGGALAATNYRWLFYLNLPLTGMVAIVIALFMNLKVPRGTMREKLGRMDWVGNAIFIPSITLVTIGLVWGGQPFSWTSSHVLAPLIIGAVGLVVWYIVERYYVEHPTVPFKLLVNRTTLIGFFTTFVHGIMALCLFYYWPVYFQAVKGASPVKSAVDFLSVAFIVAPFAMVAGGTISATQLYKPQNVVAWVLMTVGSGIMSLLHDHSPSKLWIPLPIPFSIGIGLLFAATSFPVLAPLPPSLAGQALSFMVFVRNFGSIVGITLGSVVLTNELTKKLPAEFSAHLPGGISSAYSAIPLIKTLPQPLQGEIVRAFAESMRVIWLVLIPFGGIGFIASLFMESLPLNSVTDEQWGVKEKKTHDPETNKST